MCRKNWKEVEGVTEQAERKSTHERRQSAKVEKRPVCEKRFHSPDSKTTPSEPWDVPHGVQPDHRYICRLTAPVPSI